MILAVANVVIFNFEGISSQRWTDLFNVSVEIKVNKNDSSIFHYLQFLKAIQQNNQKYVPIRLPFRRDDILEWVDVSDILFLEITHRTIMLHLIKDGFETPGDLTTESERLGPYGFLRIHRRYLVSAAHIRQYKYNNIILDNGDSLPIGKTYRKHINTILKSSLSNGPSLLYSTRL